MQRKYQGMHLIFTPGISQPQGVYSCNRPLFSSAARQRGHKQTKLNEHVYLFLLFVSSKPHYQAAEFRYIESGLFLLLIRFRSSGFDIQNSEVVGSFQP